MSDFFIDDERPWLGGYCISGDEATYFPGLWTWLVNELKIESVLDLGCGSGVSTRFFESLLPGAVVGVDGIPQKADNIYCWDFTEGRWIPPRPKAGKWPPQYDLCWCCEFLEHLEEQYLPNVFDAFRCCKYVLLTHAEPGQQGHHHVHCRTSEYWKGIMFAIGFRFDEQLTELTRAISTKNTSPYNHWLRSGMVFIRN